MSRDLSLNKIAPHHRAFSVAETDNANQISRFPFPSVKDREHSSGEENSGSQENENNNSADCNRTAEERYPEMFLLTENPDFLDLFHLGGEKKEAVLMLIVRKLRKQRGITDLLPVSNAELMNSEKTQFYRKSADWFTTHKNNDLVCVM